MLAGVTTTSKEKVPRFGQLDCARYRNEIRAAEERFKREDENHVMNTQMLRKVCNERRVAVGYIRLTLIIICQSDIKIKYSYLRLPDKPP
jgi:hypothetical protein